ncbi:hypothetical protein JCM8208_005788 [Rhodotorula glutinis]
MPHSLKAPHTASSSTPRSRSTASGSLPSSPSSTSLAIRAINPSPAKQAQPPTTSTESSPAPPAPPRPSLNLALSDPSPPPPGKRHARSVSGTLSSLFGRREPSPPPDSPASDCATRASSPSPPPSATSSTSLPFSHAPTSPIKLSTAQRSTSADPARPRSAALPTTSRDDPPALAVAQLAQSSPAPPSPKKVAKRKRRFLVHLLWRRKKGGAAVQDGVAEPRSARVEGARESASGGGGEREDVAAWVSTIGSGARGAQREIAAGDGRSGWARTEAGESSLDAGGTARGGQAAAAAYYASRPTPYRCSPSFKHLHARMTTTAISSTSLHRKKPLRHSPPSSSPRKVMNRPRPIERRTSTIGLFSFGQGHVHGYGAGGRSGEGGTAALDDGDSDFEDVEPDLDHVIRRRFDRSPAPSPASSRFLRSPPIRTRLYLSPLKLGGSTSADTSQGRSSPVWYAAARARADPSFATAPTDEHDRRSPFDTHAFDPLNPTSSRSSSRPASAASSTLSSSSDTSAQDLATAQIVVQAQAQSQSSLEQQQQVDHARRRSSVGTIVPRLRALEPVSPFKPRFEALDGSGSPSPPSSSSSAHEDSERTAGAALALAHLHSPAFRLDSDDPNTLDALRRAGLHVFGPSASSAASSSASCLAPLWDAQEGALGPPRPVSTSEGGLEGAEPAVAPLGDS